jgi:phage shock protein C
MNAPIRRLYRSRDDATLFGVCAGLGQYFRVDPVIVRLVWILGTLVTGLVPGSIAYLIAALIVPKEPAVLPHGQAQVDPDVP